MSPRNVLSAAFAAMVLAVASPVAAQSNPSCNAALQGRIAWDYAGSVDWNEDNMERLCRNGRDAQPALCFQRVMHGGVDRGDGSRWEWEHAVRLCAGSQSADATVACFLRQRAAGMSWQVASTLCTPAMLRAGAVAAPPPVVPVGLGGRDGAQRGSGRGPAGAAVTSCRINNTGFLGMGAGREAIIGVMNYTAAPRAFTVRIYATYPGNGREVVAESAVPTTPGVDATARVRFRARPGMTGIVCEVDQ